MAAGEAKLKYGATQLLFADHSGDFGSAPATAANSLIIGTPTDVQIDLTGVAANGGARESAKVDMGDPRDVQYYVDACLEFESAPTDGGSVAFYWGGSPSGTAGTGNYGVLTGSDAAITDTTGNLGQLQYIGSLSVKNAVVNIGFVGIFTPYHRYGALVIVNNASTAFRSTATAMDETHICLTPMLLYSTQS